MSRDTARADSIAEALREAGLDVLVCAFPANILLLSGYWPVVGCSLALISRDRRLTLIVPNDERDLANCGQADELITFEPASLADLRRAEDAIREPLVQVSRILLAGRGRVGYEGGGLYEPSTYSAMHLYGVGLLDLLHETFPRAELMPVSDMLERLRAVKTPTEVERIRMSCHYARRAFVEGKKRLCSGMRETTVAAAFHQSLADACGHASDLERIDGFFFCLSGPNAAKAYRAYARSRGRPIQCEEAILVHCNSYADGYWTDITRTYCLGKRAELLDRVYTAIFAARKAALTTAGPNVLAADVDHAVRDVLKQSGFGPAFKHATGHGVGFGAIDHSACPRIHPCSKEILKSGMVFNLEPAVYLDDLGGVRQCDMVAITATGTELLTPFQDTPEELTVLSL